MAASLPARAAVDCGIVGRISIPAERAGRPPDTAFRLNDGSRVFLGRMRVDADGAPRAYHPQERKGLDRLANAGHSGAWWGLATNTRDRQGDPTCAPAGAPVVQGSHDLAPGFYVSTTTMTDPSVEDCRRQRAYVNAEAIDYVALPPALATFDYRHHAGPLALVLNTRNRKQSGAVMADEAVRSGFGEGSIALARRLGYETNPRDGGSDAHTTLYVVFTDTARFPKSQRAVDAAADAAFQRWGGPQRLAVCETAVAQALR
jgi:hypothetical protein